MISKFLAASLEEATVRRWDMAAAIPSADKVERVQQHAAQLLALYRRTEGEVALIHGVRWRRLTGVSNLADFAMDHTGYSRALASELNNWLRRNGWLRSQRLGGGVMANFVCMDGEIGAAPPQVPSDDPVLAMLDELQQKLDELREVIEQRLVQTSLGRTEQKKQGGQKPPVPTQRAAPSAQASATFSDR